MTINDYFLSDLSFKSEIMQNNQLIEQLACLCY